MKSVYFNFFALSLFIMTMASCKKEVDKLGSGTSALTIVDGMTNSSISYCNFNGLQLGVPYYNQLFRLSYGNSYFFNNYGGKLKLGIFQDTTVNSKPLFNLPLNLPVNSIHTLFLMGTTQKPDTLFTTDQLPYHPPADSVMGIRFVNISQGSAPVSVNIVGKTNGSEQQNLAYKGISEFKTYPENSKVNTYTFEFRDQATGTLLGSCTVGGGPATSSGIRNIWLNQNFTLALLGASGGLASDGVLVVNEDVQQ